MSYSESLRNEGLAHISRYGSIKSAIQLFEISRSSIKWGQKKQEQDDSVSKKERDCRSYEAQVKELKAYIKEKDDA